MPAWSRIPSALQRIIRHCLEKSPQERYQSASDIAFDLEMLADPASTSLAPHAARFRKRERLAWVGVTALLVAALPFTSTYFRRAPTDGQAVYFSVAPPEKTTFTGGKAPAISPDGRYLAFVANDSSGSLNCICEHSIARAHKCWMERRALGNLFGLRTVASSDTLPKANSRKFPVGGGPPEALCDVRRMGGTWSRDGVILFSPLYGLFRVSQDGGPDACGDDARRDTPRIANRRGTAFAAVLAGWPPLSF